MGSENELLDTFTTFGDLLKFLRIRAHLTQRDLSIAVGYSEAQISRQESNKRVPSAYALKALFVPALGLDNEPEIISRLLMLAEKARDVDHPLAASVAEDEVSQDKTSKPVLHNLPRQLTSFIGREKEIEQVVRMVREHPLVTLTGPGGVGKTRLALHAASQLVDDFPDGVWLVELAPVIDPVFVPIAVASIFKVHSAPGQRLVQTLRERLASKCLLLILDNCEHVIDAVAELSTSLLKGCPNLSILATSREILDVEGEFFFRCPSLTLPDSLPVHHSTMILKRAEDSEAIQLFTQRAEAAVPGFRLTERNAAVIAKICQRLDGIPLAIELAAARLRLLSLEQVAGYMDDVFDLLAGSRRAVLPRHKTLKALIDWSYQLLSPTEQILLRRLSVFAGGWTLLAAEAVAGGDGVDPREVLCWMQQLADKSLILVETTEFGENRYRMLETIRQYAGEKIQAEGEYSVVRDRHLAFFAAMAEQANPFASHQFPSLAASQRLIKEVDNILLALKWAVETNAQLGLRLGISFGEAATLSISQELIAWIERMLGAEEERPKHQSQPIDLERTFLRGRGLLFIGQKRTFWGQQEQAAHALRESKALFELIGEPGDFFMAAASMSMGTLILSSDPEQSMMNLVTSRNAFKRLNEKTYLSECTRILVALNLYLGNLDAARQLAEECLQLCKEVGKEETAALEYLGNVELLMGNYARAKAFYDQLLESSHKYGDLIWVSYSMSQEAWVAWAQGNNERLLQLRNEMVSGGQKTGCTNFFQCADTFESLMDWARGSFEPAAQCAQEALSTYKAEYGSFVVPFVYTLGRVSLSRGDLQQAKYYFCQVYDLSDGPRWKWRAYSLHGFGLLAAAQSRDLPHMAERAAVLFGAQEKLFSWLINLLSPVEKSEYTRALSAVKEALAGDAFTTAWTKGQSMKHQETFSFALADGFLGH